MSDFSVKKSSNTKNVNKSSTVKTAYLKLKAEYLAMKKRIAKSDFANAPVTLNSELEELKKLKEFAQKENLTKEIVWIEEREQELKNKIGIDSSIGFSSAYYKPIVSFGKKEEVDSSEQTELFNELMQLCKKSDGTFDKNAEEMLSALSKQDIGLLMVVEILKRAKLDGEDINPNYTKAIVEIANAGVKNADIYTYIDEFTVKEDVSAPDIDLEGLTQALAFKKAGMYTAGAINLARYLEGNFSDKVQVKNAIMKMHKLGVSPDTIQSLLSSLAVENLVTGEKSISNKAVKTVCDLKKSLVISRENENQERRNPINLLNTIVFNVGNRTLIMKKGKVTYASPVQEESYTQAKERYDSLVSSVEDMMLVDFVSRYKDENGEIESKYLRIASSLRNAGVVYNQVLDMIDSCINDDGSINSDTLSSIVSLKKAGAMSDEIYGILSACHKNPDGTYDKKDIKNACDLTQAIIGGKEVCSLLDEVRNSENAKDFVLSTAPYIIDNTRLVELITIAKGIHSTVEENALEVLSDLVYTLIPEENTLILEDKFMSDVHSIISLARDKQGVLSDDAAGICAILCQNGEKTENIKSALMLCTTKEQKIDAKLSEILWRMGVQKAPFDEIKTILTLCINNDKSIDYNKADMILSLFEAGYSKDKILSLLKK